MFFPRINCSVYFIRIGVLNRKLSKHGTPEQADEKHPEKDKYDRISLTCGI